MRSPSTAVPLVAAFQEDIDPDDLVASAASIGAYDTANALGRSLRPLGDFADDDLVDEDDDDLMNEDDDDDEEQLGPALGLASLGGETTEEEGRTLASGLLLT